MLFSTSILPLILSETHMFEMIPSLPQVQTLKATTKPSVRTLIDDIIVPAWEGATAHCYCSAPVNGKILPTAVPDPPLPDPPLPGLFICSPKFP